jgi:branched-chain amino acid transport system substrate-binding protein
LRLHRVAALATAALLPLGPAGCKVLGDQTDTTPIVIGADLELSGADAAVGITYQRALQLKVDQVNATGGVNGRPLRLVVKDNRTDPTVSVTNIAELTGPDGAAAVVMGACSDCLMAVAKTVDDKKVPTIALAPASEVSKPVTDRRYVFKLGPNADDNANALATELRNDGIHKFALLTTDDINGSDAANAIRAQAMKVSATPSTPQLFKATDTDLTQPVHQALAKTPDALVVSAFPAQAQLVAAAARQAGFKGPMYFDSLAAGELFQAGGASAATDGVVMVAPQALVIDDVIATSPAKTARKLWFNIYTSKFGNFSGFSLYAADAVQLVVNAVKTAHGTDHDLMRDAIEDSSFEGVSGPLRLTPDNHSALTPQALTTVVVTNGRWRLQG